MKKYIYFLLILTAFTSCDFERYSPNSIPFERGFEDLGKIRALERGAYVRLRTAISPYSMIVPDIQADYVHAVYGFSNTYGDIYNWKFSQDEPEIEAVWQDFYGCIVQCNFVTEGIDRRISKLDETASTTTDVEEAAALQAEIGELNLIKGRLYLMRALSYTILAERFCADYDKETAGRQYSGLPLVISYNPDDRPSRATLAKVYETILADLGIAGDLLKNTAGSRNSTKINIDCVTALEARVLLQMDLYGEALKKANSLIGNPAYSLVESVEEYERMWEYDESPETIFQMYSSKTEAAYQWGIPFWADNNGGVQPERLMVPDYIPTKSLFEKYSDTDWRHRAFFRVGSCFEKVDDVFVLPMIKGHNALADYLAMICKYPGNPDLRTSPTWNYYNSYKVFRLAEQYLIAAEAAVMSDGDAKTPLNALRQHRGLEPLDDVTLEDVKNERYLEMMFEGTRLTDLKRWGDDMVRGVPQSGDVSETGMGPWKTLPFVSELNAEITKSNDDYMFVWPIPESEIYANPVLKDQQNPGWKR